MKDFNIFATVILVVLTLSSKASATQASAQEQGEYLPNAELATAFGSASTCYHTSMVWSEDGEELVGLRKDVHGGFGLVLNGGFDRLSYDNPDLAGTTNSFGFEAGMAYKYLQKTWPVAIKGEVKAGWYSGQTIEGLQTNGSLNCSAGLFLQLFPHSKVRLEVGGGVRYVNSVSQTTKSSITSSSEVIGDETITTTTTTTDSRRWKGNAFTYFVEGRLVAPVAKVKSTKPVTMTTSKGNTVSTKLTTTHEVEMFVGVSYTPTYKVSQQWDKTINSNRNNLRVSVGCTVYFK